VASLGVCAKLVQGRLLKHEAAKKKRFSGQKQGPTQRLGRFFASAGSTHPCPELENGKPFCWNLPLHQGPLYRIRLSRHVLFSALDDPRLTKHRYNFLPLGRCHSSVHDGLFEVKYSLHHLWFSCFQHRLGHRKDFALETWTASSIPKSKQPDSKNPKRA
jgi:hypothetical protein